MSILNCTKNSQPEIVLQHSWNCIPQKTKFYTIHGKEVTVLFPGIWNFEEGPDFRSAKISIGNNIVKGDVEIHKLPEDWIKHGHHNDERYSDVILHVVGWPAKSDLLKNDKYPAVPTIILPDSFIQESTSDKTTQYPYGYCASKFSNFSDEALYVFFENTGEKRFLEKVSIITHDILKDGVETAFLKSFFDSCGYKKNRHEFIELFNRFIEYDIDTLTVEDAVVVLWGESGLLPDPGNSNFSVEMKRFIDEIWQSWWKIRKETRDKITWHLSGVRPLNNPYRRLAAISVFISKLGTKPFSVILEEFYRISDISGVWKNFKELLVCRDDLWDNYSEPSHILNKSAAVLGEARGLDIMVNVILPFIYAYSVIHLSDDAVKEKTLSVWKLLPACQSNIVLKICSQRWLIPHERAMHVFKNSAAQQGAIFIYKRFCESGQMNCTKCPVYSLLSCPENRLPH
jgi:hypothetical protein